MDPEAPETPELNIEEAADSIAEDLHLTEPPESDSEGTGDPSPAAASEPAPKPIAGRTSDATPGAPTGVPVPSPDPVPDTWRKEAKDTWEALPPVVKEEIKKREGDIARYVNETKNSVIISKSFENIVEPYVPFFQKNNIDPWRYTQELISSHMSLLYGNPQQKQQALSRFAAQAGYRLPQGQNVQYDPGQQRINQLETELRELRQGVTGVTSAVQEARLSELEAAVMAFAQDSERHPYFDEVAEEIHRLINVGAAGTLEDAYNLAVNSNPLTRQRLIDQAIEKRSKNLASLEKARVVKAQKAAQVNVRSSRQGGSAPMMPGSIDDTLRDTLAEINSRG